MLIENRVFYGALDAFLSRLRELSFTATIEPGGPTES
jgi:hypothetical protein